MKAKAFAALVSIILIACGIAFLMATLSGCKSPEKATSYLKKKGKLSEVCATEYPVKEITIYKPGDTITNTIETPGVTITKTDTLIVNGETVYKTIGIQCPPSKSITRTVHDTILKVLESTARIDTMQLLLNDHQAQLNEVTAERDKYETRAGRWWFWILVGAALTIGIRVAFKLLA